jgi:predicted nucleic acid-binding Zn ribbon protein
VNEEKAQDALLAALDASTRLNSHEKVCAERYGDIKESFTRVHNRLDKIVYGVLGILIGMVAWLLINGQPWKS